MKNTIVAVLALTGLFFLLVKQSLALVPIQIQKNDFEIKVTLVPTATPTPLIFHKIDPNIDFKLIPTSVQTAKSTVTPNPTQETKLTVTPEVTQKVTAPEEKVTVAPSNNPEPSVVATEKSENGIDMKSLFIGITLGLLVLIIVIQLWPRKKEDQ